LRSERAKRFALRAFLRAAAKAANRPEEGKENSFPDRYPFPAVEGRSGAKGGRGINSEAWRAALCRKADLALAEPSGPLGRRRLSLWV
jgi:hypothetical protein